MKPITPAKMQNRIKIWIASIQGQMKKLDEECGIDHVPEDMMFHFEDVPSLDGSKRFNFVFDGFLYEIINGYRHDGEYQEWGSQFDTICGAETGWESEAENSFIEIFYQSF